VFLHGVADNRLSGAGVVARFVSRGFEAVTYDSRAHGESGGDFCTYGYYEKDDLRRVITALGRRRVAVIGHSLGGAVALQAAAEDERIGTVVAVESFSDLRTVAGERAFYLPAFLVERAFRYAEERGVFQASGVSPVKAAAKITVPVLVIHGTADDATSPEHSKRIYEALAGPKRLILVDGARHTQSLARADVWDTIDKWIDELVGAR
jgi:pimeloyl-ACP methyl ester carboxylesterase